MAKWAEDDLEQDDYWNQSQQMGYNFEDDDESVSIQFATASFDKTKNSLSRKFSAEVATKQLSGLSIDSDSADKRVQNCLNFLKLGNKTSHQINKRASDVIDSLLKGEDVNLSAFKGREQKLNLLDSAIKSCDGNAIISVVLFLKNTLKDSIFNFEIKKRVEAADHYINYLRQIGSSNELVDTLTMLGRDEEAAMFKYSQAILHKNCDTKMRTLRNCLQNHFSSGIPSITFWSPFISEQIALLERQLPIEFEAEKQERQMQSSQVIESLSLAPRISILNKPVITTLYYCCLYHFDLPENYLASPLAISKSHKLTEKQFQWTALLALAQVQRWTQIEALFQAKSWLGKTKVKSSLPYENIAKILNKHNAPEDVILKYLELVDNNETKLELAKEFKLHRTVIDIFIKLKDRKSLEDYIIQNLSTQHREYFYAQNALRSSDIKWKN